jgi:hypothetical protein
METNKKIEEIKKNYDKLSEGGKKIIDGFLMALIENDKKKKQNENL